MSGKSEMLRRLQFESKSWVPLQIYKHNICKSLLIGPEGIGNQRYLLWQTQLLCYMITPLECVRYVHVDQDVSHMSRNTGQGKYDVV